MTALFQQLPSVDKFLKTPEGEMLLTEFGHSAVVRELRQLLSDGASLSNSINIYRTFLPII